MNEILKSGSDSIIAAALEKNLIEQVKFFGKSPLVNFYDETDMVSIVKGLPVSILNLVAGTNLSKDRIYDKIDSALIPFKKQQVPAIWWVGPTTVPNDLGKHLEEHGLEKNFDMPGMYYELDNLEEELQLPSDFSYKIVDNEQLLRIWAETQTKGFGGDDTGTKPIYLFEKSLGTHSQSPWLRYIGFIGKEPVGVSILFQGAGVAAVFNVAVVPEYRRQGVGSFMTKIPLFKARSLGYKYGVLKASPMGTYLYRQMQFKECCKIGLYYLPQKL